MCCNGLIIYLTFIVVDLSDKVSQIASNQINLTHSLCFEVLYSCVEQLINQFAHIYMLLCHISFKSFLLWKYFLKLGDTKLLFLIWTCIYVTEWVLGWKFLSVALEQKLILMRCLCQTWWKVFLKVYFWRGSVVIRDYLIILAQSFPKVSCFILLHWLVTRNCPKGGSRKIFISRTGRSKKKSLENAGLLVSRF